MMNNKKLDPLYIKRDKLRELIKYANLLGGKLHIGNNDIPVDQLKKALTNVNAEISVAISNGKLKLINPNKK